MTRAILVPLDGSAFGEHALPLAVSLARQAGAALHLVHVHQIAPAATLDGIDVMSSLELYLWQDEHAYLADTARRLGEMATVPLTKSLIEGDVGPALRQYAEQYHIDLVVLSTHGRGALGRFWLGSVADEMVRDLEVPLLLVRPEERWVDLDQEAVPGKVVLPLDGTELAEAILEPAVAIAGLMPHMEFTLIRAVKPVTPLYALREPVVAGLAEMQEDLEQEAIAYLDTVADRLRARGLQVRTHVVVEDQPAQAILHEAETTGAGLIALETHGRRGLARLVMGSVADQVVRGTHVPVLVQRPAHV